LRGRKSLDQTDLGMILYGHPQYIVGSERIMGSAGPLHAEPSRPSRTD
jgi:hypothetical protein